MDECQALPDPCCEEKIKAHPVPFFFRESSPPAKWKLGPRKRGKCHCFNFEKICFIDKFATGPHFDGPPVIGKLGHRSFGNAWRTHESKSPLAFVAFKIQTGNQVCQRLKEFSCGQSFRMGIPCGMWGGPVFQWDSWRWIKVCQAHRTREKRRGRELCCFWFRT